MKKERKNYQGLMSVCRVSAGAAKPLYGSRVAHSSSVLIEIAEATDDRTYGQDSFFKGKVLASVEMSPVQWADLITNMNSSGTPVTIKSVGDEKMDEPSVDITDTVGKIKKDSERADDFVKERVGNVVSRLKECVDSKKALPATAAKDLLDALETALRNYDSDRAFYREQAVKEVEMMVVEGVKTVESRLESKIMEMGIEAIGRTKSAIEDKRQP